MTINAAQLLTALMMYHRATDGLGVNLVELGVEWEKQSAVKNCPACPEDAERSEESRGKPVVAPSLDGAFGAQIRVGNKLSTNEKWVLSSFVGASNAAVQAAQKAQLPDSVDPVPEGGDRGTV